MRPQNCVSPLRKSRNCSFPQKWMSKKENSQRTTAVPPQKWLKEKKSRYLKCSWPTEGTVQILYILDAQAYLKTIFKIHTVIYWCFRCFSTYLLIWLQIASTMPKTLSETKRQIQECIYQEHLLGKFGFFNVNLLKEFGRNSFDILFFFSLFYLDLSGQNSLSTWTFFHSHF